MDTGNPTLWLAFLAGLASFLSPCVLALVPAYIGYLGGRVLSTGETALADRALTFSHGLAFVLGFSLVFVALGSAASLIGAVLYDLRRWLSIIGGAVVILFGLHVMGVIRVPLLDYDLRAQGRLPSRSGYLSSALMGVFFSAGWSPCVGPVLGTILTLALSGADVAQGALLLTFYSAGLAVPFLLAALGVGRVAEWIHRYRRWMRLASIATGVLLIIVGVMLMTGTMERLANFGFLVDFGL